MANIQLIQTCIINQVFVCAIEYGDMSGLDDEEEKLVCGWLDNYQYCMFEYNARTMIFSSPTLTSGRRQTIIVTQCMPSLLLIGKNQKMSKQMSTQKLIITAEQATSVLDLAIACFKCGAQLRKPIREFVSQNYSLDDFREKGVNPFDFDDWLKCGKKL